MSSVEDLSQVILDKILHGTRKIVSSGRSGCCHHNNITITQSLKSHSPEQMGSLRSPLYYQVSPFSLSYFSELHYFSEWVASLANTRYTQMVECIRKRCKWRRQQNIRTQRVHKSLHHLELLFHLSLHGSIDMTESTQRTLMVWHPAKTLGTSTLLTHVLMSTIPVGLVVISTKREKLLYTMASRIFFCRTHLIRGSSKWLKIDTWCGRTLIPGRQLQFCEL